MKRIIVPVLALMLMLTACANTQQAETSWTTTGNGGVMTVGISLPNDSDGWADQGAAMERQLMELGYEVILQYAREDALLQVSQVEKFVAQPVDCMILAALDGLLLTDALEQAKQAGIPVIAYDRMLMNTDAVISYAGFDSYAAGVTMGSYIEEARQLKTAASEGRSNTVEFFMGSPDDSNALRFYEGLMQVLSPYLDSGVLVCRSGRTGFEDCCIQAAAPETAQAVCSRILEEFYTETAPDICCCAMDSIAGGVSQELSLWEQDVSRILITGQGAEPEAVQRILSGAQTVTLYQDTDVMVRQCVIMADAVLTGQGMGGTVEYSNGVLEVPSWQCEPVVVDASNYQQVLMDTGVYTREEAEEPPEPTQITTENLKG